MIVLVSLFDGLGNFGVSQESLGDLNIDELFSIHRIYDFLLISCQTRNFLGINLILFESLCRGLIYER